MKSLFFLDTNSRLDKEGFEGVDPKPVPLYVACYASLYTCDFSLFMTSLWSVRGVACSTGGLVN